MNIFHSFDEITYDENTILTVGTFDGVHRGHRTVIRKLMELAQHRGLRHIILTMHPHPQIVLQRSTQTPVKHLTSIDERLELFRRLEVGNVLVIPFTREFARTPPEAFVRESLYGKIGLKSILVGYDHLFGRNRKGDETLLQSLGRELGFEVIRIDAFGENDLIISSTAIRQALLSKNIEQANELLGYDYFAIGKVVRSSGRGRSIGYPSANVELSDPHKLLPSRGVYLVESTIGERKYFGMANIGTRPTFAHNNKPDFEIHFFDFAGDIYEHELNVSFLCYIRNEKKFSGSDALAAALKNDEKICRGEIEKRCGIGRTISTHSPPIRKLEWDSNFFGFNIAQAYFTDENIDTRCIDIFCEKNDIVLVQTCIQIGNARVIDALEGCGYRFVDLKLTLEVKISGKPPLRQHPVEFATLDDLDELKALTHSLFSGSRYYTFELTRSKADDFYKIWIENAVKGIFDDFCIIHRIRGKIAGFVTAKLGGGAARIGLIGVSPKMHDKGIGSLLVKKLIHILSHRNIDTLRVVTQGANTAALNLYIKNGFAVKDMEMWLYKITGRKKC